MNPLEQIYHDLSYAFLAGFTFLYLALLEYFVEMLLFGRTFYGLLAILFVCMYVVNKRIYG